MREIDFLETDVATAFNSWLKLASPIIEVTATAYRAFDVVVDTVDDRKDWTPLNLSLNFDAPRTYEAAKRHRDDGYGTLNTLTLLAAWGVFEAMVEDVSKAMIRMQPALLDSEKFQSAKRRADSHSIAPEQYAEYVTDHALRNVRGPTNEDPRSQYERQLGLAKLHGAVPTDLHLTLNTAQEVRNVWAHRSGRADSKFVASCSHLGHKIGDPVPVTVESINEFIVALNTYASIILNRFRLQLGLDALECYQGETNHFKAGFDQIYPDAISPETLQERIESEYSVLPK